MTTTWKTRKGVVSTLAAFLLVALLCACGPNEGVLKSGRSTSTPTNSASKLASIEADVDEMRTANFTTIFVLRRKDGGPIDAEDRSVIKSNTDGVNRRISSDNGKAFVIGSNSPIPADKMAPLYDRFAVENYSPPENLIIDGNANAK